ncbi:MAG TPA: hypothetical protein VGG35_11250 [Streptosporangiaceae bacterium]|jgi:hypothetical protein
MTQIARHCPDCGVSQPFDQVHDQPGECPDFPGGDCPEWCCIACGAALLIGTVPAGAASAGTASAGTVSELVLAGAQPRGRVA